MSDILQGLNEQQTKAVTYSAGPLLVLAGPGAGKTTVLTRRIAYILNESKGEHFKILALTFTNKAAKEMRDRIEELVGEELRRVFIGTFHSFSYDLLKTYGNYIDISTNFIVYDKTEDFIKLLADGVRKRVEKELTGEIEASVLSKKYRDIRVIAKTMPDVYNKIIRLKNRAVFHDDLSLLSEEPLEELRLIFDIYNNELKESSALDFPDLILYANKLLKEKPFIANQIKRINRHILIDEGQDTNKAQYELITKICGDHFQNLFIVADEDQLIFEWNDARFEYLVSLVETYNAETIQLYESYRCPIQVLEVANRLIKHNKIRIATKGDLLPKKGTANGSIEVVAFNSSTDESRFVCEKIKELNRYTNTCVISRNRYLLNNIMDNLDAHSIPYYVPMGQERFSTREMNLIINIMWLIFNENDKLHLYGICEYFGLNYEDLVEEAGEKSLLQRLRGTIRGNAECKDLISILDAFKNSKNNFKILYDKLKEALIGDREEDEDIAEDIELFEETYQRYTYDRIAADRDLGDFLNYISLAPKRDLKNEGVALLTAHAAKGLEFDYVFLISMNQGIFPDYRAKQGTRALEEERRNCFVAITRTREKLFISYTRLKNTRFGTREHEHSQFLKEMGLVL